MGKQQLPGQGAARLVLHSAPCRPQCPWTAGLWCCQPLVTSLGGSSPSEDSCLLELQGSVRSVDYVLFRSIQRSRAGYCLSLDCGLRGPFEESPLPRRPPRAARSYSCSAPEAPPPLGAPTAARSCHRLEGWPPWVGPCFPELRRRVPRGGGRPAAAPPTRAPTRRFSDSSGSLTPPGAPASSSGIPTTAAAASVPQRPRHHHLQ